MVNQELDSFALFAHLDVKPVDMLTIYVGGRHTWDKKHFAATLPSAIDATASWRNLSMEAGVNLQVTPDHMIYGRFSQGYIAGGFNLAAIPFGSEKIDSYEVGIKTQWFDRRLLLNAVAFHYDYKNLQRISTRVLDNGFFLSAPVNVGSATVEGVEIELTAVPAEGLRFQGAVGYLDAHYDRFDLGVVQGGVLVTFDNSGQRFPYAPKWTLSGSIEYDINLVGANGPIGTLTPLISARYVSMHSVGTDDIPLLNQKGYGVINASLRFTDPDKKYYVAIFANNITDKHYITNASRLGGVTSFKTDAPPLTYGIRFGIDY